MDLSSDLPCTELPTSQRTSMVLLLMASYDMKHMNTSHTRHLFNGFVTFSIEHHHVISLHWLLHFMMFILLFLTLRLEWIGVHGTGTFHPWSIPLLREQGWVVRQVRSQCKLLTLLLSAQTQAHETNGKGCRLMDECRLVGAGRASVG